MLSTEKKIYEENTEIKEEIKTTETTEIVTENKEPIKPEQIDEAEMELLTDLKKSTDKDIDKTTKIETNEDGTVKVTTTTENKTTSIHYANHELVASLTVSAISVTMCLILQFVADNWTEEAEKKYLLTPNKKQQLLEPLTLVLAQSKSKYNPVVILVITVLVLYVPNFISAFRERNAKKKAELSKKGKTKEIKTENLEEAQLQETEEKEPEKKSGKKETTVITKEIFKMTKAQNERLLKIKSKRGARSEADKEFIKEMGLQGLV